MWPPLKVPCTTYVMTTSIHHLKATTPTWVRNHWTFCHCLPASCQSLFWSNRLALEPQLSLPDPTAASLFLRYRSSELHSFSIFSSVLENGWIGSLWATSLTFRWRKPQLLSSRNPTGCCRAIQRSNKGNWDGGGPLKGHTMSIQEEEWSSGPPPAHWRCTNSGSLRGLYLSLSSRRPLCALCGGWMWSSVEISRSEWTSRLMTADADGTFQSLSRAPRDRRATRCVPCSGLWAR